MPTLIRKPRNFWTKKACQTEAKHFTSRTAWSDSSPRSYNVARENDWIDECSKHMVPKIKPMGYWTKHRCIIEAKKFKSRSDWAKQSGSSYNVALEKGWLEESCVHMVRKVKPNGYWTKERCLEEAQKYKRPSLWQKGSGSSYGVAGKKGWLDECCTHMSDRKMKNGYWTEEKCQIEARKYETRTQLARNCMGAYHAAIENNWLDRICSHMKVKVRSDGYPLDELVSVASNFGTRKEFRRAFPQMYLWAGRRKLIDKICVHMRRLGNRKFRQLYVFEHPDKTVYVGLSYDPEERRKQHLNGTRTDTVSLTLREKKQKFQHQQVFKLFPEFIPQQEAGRAEETLIRQYEKDGWVVLNTAKGGALGGVVRKHTLFSCRNFCLKYAKRSHVEKANGSLYHAILKNGWQKDCFGHMKITKHPRYSDTHLKKVIASVASLRELHEKYPKENTAIRKRANFKKWTRHLTRERKVHSDESIKACALRCSTKIEFITKYPAEYSAAKRRGIYEDICKHMRSRTIRAKLG